MRFGRDKLIFMGLAALDEACARVRERPFEPDLALRTVLAMLFALSDGDREAFNDFWRACRRRPHPSRTPNVEDICRANDADRALNEIRIALRWAPTITLGEDIARARSKPLPHADAAELHHGHPRNSRECQRRGFAEWWREAEGIGRDDDRIDSRGRWFNASRMCNLYANRRTAAEIARLFRAEPVGGSNAGEEMLPGRPGLVVREQGAARVLQSMTWGFPYSAKSKRTGEPLKPKPVNNIANLDGYLWRFIAPNPENRCLIPLTAFAEAEGEKGAKTRTWFSVADQPVFAWAGMWKDSPEWGPVYSGLMTAANATVAAVHNRMPVLLLPDEHDRWLRGSIGDVRAFQDRTFPAELIVIDRTDELWVKR